MAPLAYSVPVGQPVLLLCICVVAEQTSLPGCRKMRGVSEKSRRGEDAERGGHGEDAEKGV